MTMPDYNAAKIAIALLGYKSGGGWMARCPAHDDSTPSLALRDAEDGRVLIHCHAGCDQKSVIAALAKRRLWTNSSSVEAHMPSNTGQPAAVSEKGTDERRRTFSALRLWAQTSHATGTPVETYLRLRGITIAIPKTLKFHCGLKHPNGKLLPAMVSIVIHGTNNKPVGIHRTFLDPQTHVRIPAMTTMLSGAWRPLDPVDDDQGGARA